MSIKYFLFSLIIVLNLFSNTDIKSLTNEEKGWIKNNTVIIGTEYWKPIVYHNKQTNKLDGIVGDILNIAFKNLNLKTTIVSGKWKDILNDFKNGKSDLLPAVYYTKDRESFGNYSKKFFSLPEYLYVKDTNKNIKQFNDLKDKKLAIIKGYAMIDMVHKKYPSINIIQTQNLQQSINYVLDGTVDALIDSQIVVENYILENVISGLKGISQEAFPPNDVYLLSNIKKPILKSILQKGLDSIAKDEKNSIIFKWIKDQSTKERELSFLSLKEVSYLKTKKVIKMCNNPNWAPIEFAQNGNMEKMEGISIDTIKAVEKILNIKFQTVKTQNWSQSQQFLKEKKCDILPCAVKTAKREKYANFTKPYLNLPLAIFTTKDKQIVSGLDKIIDKPWARKKGSGVIAKIKQIYPNTKIIETKDNTKALQLVNSGDVYFTIATLPVASYAISKYMLTNLQISGYTDIAFKLSIAVRDDDKILLSILDKTLSQIPSSESKKIFSKWVNSTVTQKVTDYTLLWQIMLIILLITLFFIYKQYLLKQSLNQSHELLNATMEAIILHKNGKCVEVNSSAKDMFEIDLIGQNILDFVTPKSFEFVKKKMAKEDTKQYEAILKTATGKEFYGLIHAKYLVSRNLRFVSIIDITELKNQEKLIAQQSKMASMGEMIGNIAHQWRQPLSVISTAATGMLVQKEHNMLSDERFKESCKAIDNNVQYLSKTIDDFRNFIKGDRVARSFKIEHTIKSFLNLIEGTKKSSKITIIVNLEDDLIVDGYENELIQCFINIFNNAKDVLVSLDEIDRFFFITVSKSKNSKIIISFKDSGGGIPNDILPKIFEPYFTTKHKSRGTGLGLHMTYNLIVDGMKGKFEVKNVEYSYNEKLYRGADFRIII